MRLAALLLSAAAALSAPVADAATLRASATVDADVLRVGDIFDDAGHLAEAIIAPAPRPGRRYVLDANWLADNARAMGIDWRPATRFDRIVVERPGRIVGREAITEALREAMRAEGGATVGGIEYAGRVPELSVPLQAPPGLEVQSLSFDRATGRFSALVVAGAGHPSAQRLPVSGRLVATRPVPVLRRAVQPGEVVRAGDVEFVEVREEGLRREILVDADRVVGQSARRPLRAGEMLRENDLRAPLLVSRNGLVTIVLRNGGMSLSAQGRALEDGARGETIRVVNVQSKRTIEAQVIGPDAVAVVAGARAGDDGDGIRADHLRLDGALALDVDDADRLAARAVLEGPALGAEAHAAVAQNDGDEAVAADEQGRAQVVLAQHLAGAQRAPRALADDAVGVDEDLAAKPFLADLHELHVAGAHDLARLDGAPQHRDRAGRDQAAGDGEPLRRGMAGAGDDERREAAGGAIEGKRLDLEAGRGLQRHGELGHAPGVLDAADRGAALRAHRLAQGLGDRLAADDAAGALDDDAVEARGRAPVDPHGARVVGEPVGVEHVAAAGARRRGDDRLGQVAGVVEDVADAQDVGVDGGRGAQGRGVGDGRGQGRGGGEEEGCEAHGCPHPQRSWFRDDIISSDAWMTLEFIS